MSHTFRLGDVDFSLTFSLHDGRDAGLYRLDIAFCCPSVQVNAHIAELLTEDMRRFGLSVDNWKPYMSHDGDYCTLHYRTPPMGLGGASIIERRVEHYAETRQRQHSR